MAMATAGTSTSANSEDAWGQPATSVINTSRRPVVQSTPVPDSWDADEDEEEKDPKELWENANSRAPMPEVQLSTTTSPAGAQLPPAAAFEAPLRILKRPSSANSKSPSPSTGVQAQKSFKEREAQYQAARERIFGEDATGKDKDRGESGSLKPAPNATRSGIIRDPLGPATTAVDGDSKRGFRGRRRKGSPAVTSASTPEESGDAKKDDCET